MTASVTPTHFLPGHCEAAERRVMSGVRKQGGRAIALEEGILAQETWAEMAKVEELSAELSSVHLWDGFRFLLD